MKKNRLLALFTALVLVISTMLSSVSFAAENTDVAGTDFEGVVGKLNAVGVMTGYPDGTFRPDGEITRAEFAAIAVRALGLGDAANVSVANTKFSDVTYSHWASGYINLAVDRGILKGYTDGTFKPEGKITNAEAITILVRLLGLAPVVDKEGTWPANYIAAANVNGILDDVVVDSTKNATRGNAAIMLVNTLEAELWGPEGYNDNGTVNYGVLEGKTLLSENLKIENKENVMITDVEDDEIEIFGKDYDYVGVELDKEEYFLNLVDAWVNADDEVIYVANNSEVKFDAIKVDKGNENVKGIEADKKYDLATDEDDDLVVEVYVNGVSKNLSYVDGVTYDYAKLVFNDKNDVVAISAYDWDDYIVVEEVDDYDVFGYGDELDVEDYTIVKDGVTIAVADLEEGDILFYNTDAEYADVYTNVDAEGVVEDVFVDHFEVDGTDYEYDNTAYVKSAQYVNEDGKIADFGESAAEQMEDEEGDVSVFVDRLGNVVFVSGDLGVAPTTTVGAILYEDAEAYTDTRTKEYLELKVVNEEDEKVTYDFKISDLETITVDNTEIEVSTIELTDREADDKGLEHIYHSITVNSSEVIDVDEDNDSDGTIDLKEGKLIELTFNEDGDIIGLGIFRSDAVAFGIGDDVESGDRYIQSRRVADSVPVFIVDKDITNFDSDDVTVLSYGELEDDIDLKVGTVYADDNDALYVVVSESDYNSTTKVDAVIYEVRYKPDTSKIERVKAYVDGEKVTYYMDEATAVSYVTEGVAVEIETYDANGKIKGFSKAKLKGYEALEDVAIRDKEIKANGTTYELVSGAYIYDVTDTSDISEMSLSDLADALDDDDKNVAVAVYEEKVGSRYVTFVLVDTDSDTGTVTPPTGDVEGTVTYVDADGKAVTSVTLENGQDLELTVKFTNNGDTSVSLSTNDAKATVVDADGATVGSVINLNTAPLVVLSEKTVTFDTDIDVSGLTLGEYTVLVTIPLGTETIESTIEVEVVKSDDATLSDLTVDGTTVADFDADTTEYTVKLADGTVIIPTVGATENNANANSVVTQAAAVDGTATVVVTAEDGETTKTYTVVFVLNNAPTVANALPDITPTATDGNVVIDLSDVFADEDSDELTYSVSVATGTDITSAIVNDNELIIVPAGTTGTTATVTVTADDGLDTVNDVFNVTFQ